ncbi:MAG: T9SS type A sorting domain-containing protein, partial [Bacteroides sp.]|nr:T9SS type A sorting domain-containing protein [Bacteroides sp.]
YAGGDQIPASGFTPCIFFRPASAWLLESLIYITDDEFIVEHDPQQVDENAPNHAGWMMIEGFSPVMSDLTISAVFAVDAQDLPLTEADMGSGDVEIYDLNGVKIIDTRLAPGIYIVRQNGKTTKVSIH